MSLVDDLKNKIMGGDSRGSDTAVPGLPSDTPDTEKRAKGRPRKNESGSKPTSSESDKIGKEINDLFSPDNFRALVRVPADLRLAVTGRKHWELRDSEVNSLAVTASTTAKYFAVADPKWLALAMFVTNATLIYGSRIAEDLRMNRKENENK